MSTKRTHPVRKGHAYMSLDSTTPLSAKELYYVKEVENTTRFGRPWQLAFVSRLLFDPRNRNWYERETYQKWVDDDFGLEVPDHLMDEVMSVFER